MAIQSQFVREMRIISFWIAISPWFCGGTCKILILKESSNDVESGLKNKQHENFPNYLGTEDSKTRQNEHKKFQRGE